jgi:hypothetical protein
MRFRYRTLAALLLTGGAFTSAGGQEPVRLSGRVITAEDQSAIADARVELLNRREDVLAAMITDDGGSFQFVLPGHDGYAFRASRLGFRETTTPILWTDRYGDVEVEIRLDPEAILLAPLEVTAWARRVQPSPVLAGFRARLDIGLGHFFTREDIERLKPAMVTDLIGRVPGVRLQSSGSGINRAIYIARAAFGARDCPAQIYVDGFLMNRQIASGDRLPFALDAAVTPASVEGIEVYHGLASVPAEFFTPHASCGVVAVWTRRGG